MQGEQAVVIHPQDAAERGIVDGQYVRVFNDRGQYVALAKVSDEVAPGVAVICRWAPGRRTPRTARRSTRSTRSLFADLGNAPTFSDTRVEVEPI